MYHAPSRAVSRARDWARSEDAAIRISDSGREWWPKVEKRHRRWREREVVAEHGGWVGQCEVAAGAPPLCRVPDEHWW
jgi:hypothetical protein